MSHAHLPLPHEVPDTSSVFIIGLHQLRDRHVLSGIAYWEFLSGGRRFPARSELVLRDMAPFLRDLVLIRVIDRGTDYQYRIVGDAHVEVHGPFSGARLSQIEMIAPEQGHISRATYEHVRNTREPFALRGWLGRDNPRAKFVYHESAFLPLGEDGETVDHLLVVTQYVKRLARR